MAKDTARIPLLLAVLLFATAHGAALGNTSSIGKVDVAHKVASSVVDRKAIKSSVTRKLSVVQDWSLVCKELCGADLGGSRCASVCEESRLIERKADSILEPNRDAVCFDLCTSGLGGSMCDCPAFDESEQENDVCNAFCQHNNITLNGCSECITEEEAVKEAQGKEVYAAPDVTPTTSTTPNWDELCITLCKKGDGGVLCNCDLPPLL